MDGELFIVILKAYLNHNYFNIGVWSLVLVINCASSA